MDKAEKCINNISIVKSIMNDPETSKTYQHLNRIFKRGLWTYLTDFLSLASTTSVSNEYHEFFVSVRHLSEQFGHSYNTWNRNISVFVTLGLINRIPYEDSVISLKANYDYLDDEDSLKPVNVYRVPVYDAAILEEANKRAEVMYEHHYRLGSFDKTFLIKTFDQEFSNSVFPDERAVTKHSKYVAKQIENFILRDIERYGYTTKKRVINITHINLKKVTSQEYGFHRSSKRNILDREFGHWISDICEGYGLYYGRATKEIMKRFRLKTPITVICKDDAD